MRISLCAVAVCLGVFAVGCGPNAASDSPDSGPSEPIACTPGERVCVGNAIHDCSDQGEPGDLVDTCPNGCAGGVCATGDNCAGGAVEFVYVVDTGNRLYAFDPSGDAHTFTTIGTLGCPAGAPLGDPGGLLGPATPFSMSVDRDATAWVLYSSGELFHVSTEDASCAATSFQKQQQGYDLFGMGFVSDSAGSDIEKLYVSGSLLDPLTGELTDTKIGFIDKSTLQISHLGNMANLENPPELTGTGAAKLYGYFPGSASTVAELSKVDGQQMAGRAWPAGSISGGEQLAGWAFAQWGGRFYVFVTTQAGLLGGTTSKVIRVDPNANGGAGEAVTVVGNGAPFIVGAGVSTCAPVVVD